MINGQTDGRRTRKLISESTKLEIAETMKRNLVKNSDGFWQYNTPSINDELIAETFKTKVQNVKRIRVAQFGKMAPGNMHTVNKPLAVKSYSETKAKINKIDAQAEKKVDVQPSLTQRIINLEQLNQQISAKLDRLLQELT